MSFIDTINGFFREQKTDPAMLASRAAFSSASDIVDAALKAIWPYTTRSNHRHEISRARYALHTAPHATDAYNEAVAAYTDPADFKSYTVAYLDEHTAAIVALNVAFEKLTATFSAWTATDPIYPAASKLYESTYKNYEFAVKAFARAADCAMGTALECNVQAAKNEFELYLLDTIADNAPATEAASRKRKANAFRTEAVTNAEEARLLETKAHEAGALANSLLGKTTNLGTDRADR